MKRAIYIALAACGTNQTPQPAPVPTLPSCVPNRDGTITADELPIAIGFSLDYYASTNLAVNLAGTSGVWDLSDEHKDDQVVAVGPLALLDQWYVDSFPTGEFVVDAGSGIDAIYHQDERALWLDGTASHIPSGQTLAPYVTPIEVLRFPITDGQAFTSVGQLMSVQITGLPFIGTDTVDVDVTGSGRLDVPYVDFSPVLRVRTHTVRRPSTGTPTVGKRTTLFMFECFGEVAHAESKQDEPDPDFTFAAYLRRFALGVTP